MVKNRKVLYISPSDGKLYSELVTSSVVTDISLTQGDDVTIELHMCKLLDGELIEVPFPASSQVKLAVGRLDTPAVSGTYKITYGMEETTLAYNSTAAQVQTALNLMASITSSGGVTVSKVNNVVNQVIFNNPGVNSSFELDTSGLIPTMYSRVIPIRVGDSTHRGIYGLKVAQAPVVYQTQWDDRSTIDTPTATITTINTGHKRLTIYPIPPSGLMSITTTPNVYRKTYLQGTFDWYGPPAAGNPPSYYYGQLETVLVPVTADDTYFQFRATAQQQNFYNYVVGPNVPSFKAFNDVEDYFQPHITNIAPGVWDFIWNYNIAGWTPPMWQTGFYFPYLQDPASYTTIPVGYDYPISVDLASVTPFEGKIANLNLNSIDIEYFLGGAASVAGMLEIELTTDDYKQTILQSTCTIINDMIDGYAYSPIDLDVAHIPDAPSDGIFYGRKDGGWTPLTEIDGGSY
jgi:hypothetical protein